MTEEEQKDQIPIDFASLKETNEDIYAWIDIPDTNIHYPIVQSQTDDSYYLNHTIEGQKVSGFDLYRTFECERFFGF